MMQAFHLARAGLCSLLLAFAALPAAAQQQQPATSGTPSTPVVMVVDFQHLMRESKSAKGVRSQIQQIRGGYQKDLSKTEEELRSAQQELGRQRTILSQEAFAAKVRDYEQRLGEVQKRVQNLRRELARVEGEAMNKVEAAMLEVITEIATERKATLVMSKQTLVLFDKNYEVTDEVLKRLDTKLPAVTVAQPKPPEPAPAKAPAQPPAPATGAAKGKATPPPKKN